ncbi:hypothetical protein Daus18300_013742 [Diaporthe australafricana]|uniref:Uncharacterized protein n=1 Tax=Diaporthe australafricana TaxID=127596 RepID=A0ABR3VXV5_9PEZI
MLQIPDIHNEEMEIEPQALRNYLWPRETAETHSALNDLSAKLVYDLQMMQVTTSAGTAYLHNCVLPGIDSRFEDDKDIRLYTLDLVGYSPEVRRRLKSLWISTEADALFYIKCLLALRRQVSPPHNTVAQVYEEIQSRFEEDTGIIR